MSKMKKIRCAYEFFNCDENRTHTSMNPLYEQNVYRDTRDSRRKLWKRIKTEYENHNIVIDEKNMNTIRKMIMEDSPSKVNDYMKYGIILEKTMMD